MKKKNKSPMQARERDGFHAKHVSKRRAPNYQQRALTRNERIFLAVVAGAQLLVGIKFLSHGTVGAAAMPVQPSRQQSTSSNPGVCEFNPLGFFMANDSCPAQPRFPTSVVMTGSITGIGHKVDVAGSNLSTVITPKVVNTEMRVNKYTANSYSAIVRDWSGWNNKFLEILHEGKDLNVSKLRESVGQFVSEYPDWKNNCAINDKIDLYRGLISSAYYNKADSFDNARILLTEAKGIVAGFDKNDPVKVWFDNKLPYLEGGIEIRAHGKLVGEIPNKCGNNASCENRAYVDEVSKVEPYFPLMIDQEETRPVLFKLRLLRGTSYFALGQVEQGMADIEAASKLIDGKDKRVSMMREALTQIGIGTYFTVDAGLRARFDKVIELSRPKSYVEQMQNTVFGYWSYLLAVIGVAFTYFFGVRPATRKLKVVRAVRRQRELGTCTK